MLIRVNNRVSDAGLVLGEQVAGLIDGLHDFAEGFFDVGSAHTVLLGLCYVLGERVWAEPAWTVAP